MANEASGTNISPRIRYFLRIIRTQTLRSNKLKIPKKIVRKCRATLTDEVLLNLPLSREWKVGLTKSSDGNVWIEKGWPEFSKYYSLARGHLLLFMYESHSQFQVSIFNKTTTEINYLSRRNKQVKKKTKDNENQDTFSRPFPKTRSRSAFPYSQPIKRRETSPLGKLNLPEKRCGGENNNPGRRLSAKEKAEAQKRVDSFKSNHPYFIHPMQPSYVRGHYTLNLPSDFARSYLGSSKKDLILKAVDGRTWSVRYTGFESKGSKPRFETGWKAFALANDLKRGDVCVFAMTKKTRSILFEVSIFRANEIINSASVPEKNGSGSKLRLRRSLVSKVESTNTTANKKTKTSTTGRFVKQLTSDQRARSPSFTVHMTASYATGRCNFYIPAKFSKTYITKKVGTARLWVSDSRSWSVIYKVKRGIDGNSRTTFCDGWRVFAVENGLEVGDTCTFELTNTDKEDIVFEVNIAKPSPKRVKCEEITGGEVTWISKASKVANKSR